MATFDRFIIDSYELDHRARAIRLRYALDAQEHFEEVIFLPQDRPLPETVSPELNAALLALHIAGGVSYYKTACPARIDVDSGALSPDMSAFWHDVYEKGLGEFFYQNKIDFRGRIAFPSSTANPSPPLPAAPRSAPRRALVPIGGGKDSMVTIELLRQSGAAVTLLRMGSHPLITRLAAATGLPLLTVERRLSPRLFAMNAEGALNGHVPITAYLSCLTVVLALLYDFDTVAFSNERSANEGNVEYLGCEINHQWSKSLEFERAWRGYLQRHVTTAVDYMSLLRPLSELSIARVVAGLPQYRTLVTSCNANWKIAGERQSQRWCGHCPKCLFSFILFAAFLNRNDLEAMFGAVLLDDASLAPLFDELTGRSGHKPFECVGTPEETVAALALAHARGDLDGTALMRRATEQILPGSDIDALLQRCSAPTADHCLPEDLSPLVYAAA